MIDSKQLVAPAPMSSRLVSIAALASLFGLLAYLGVTLTRDQNRIAAVWLPNAVLIALMLRYHRQDYWTLAAAFGANIIANSLAGDAIGRALGLSAVNSLEIIIVCTGMRRLGRVRPDMAKFKDLMAFSIIGGIVAPVPAGLLAAVILSPAGDVNLHLWLTWSLTDALGLLLFAPSIWVALDSWERRARPSRERIVEWILVLAGGFVVTTLVFLQSSYPLLYVATPVVLLAAFRLGGLGAAAATIMVAVIASIATSHGTGPISLVRGDMTDRLHTLQGFLVVNFCMSLPVAASLAGRAAIARALTASQDLNRSMLDNMREVIFKTDADGRWIFLNPAWEEMTGYTVAESLGWRTTKLLHPEGSDEITDVYPKLVSGALTEATMRQRFGHKSGEQRHIEISIRRLADENGSFLGTTGNIRDITDAVRQQQALAQSEMRFQRMAEAAPIGIFRADAAGNVTYVNEAWCAKIGLTVEQSLGNGWMTALVNVEDYEHLPPWQGFEKPGDVRRRIAHFRASDGGDLWCETVNTPEFDDSGQIVGFIGAVNDITEQRRMERELVERDEQLSLLANNATDAVFRLSLDGRCLYASPSAEGLLGIAARHLIGASLIDRLHPDDRAIVTETFAALVDGRRENQIIAYRSELLHETGKWRWLEANCGLVRDTTTGAPIEIIASIRDVSANKAMEEDLRIARSRAETAAAAKSAFLANMSHEIRTPMNGVIGFTELLSGSQLDEEQRRYVDLIAESGRSMMKLLNDILDISKIEAGQMQIADDPMDLRHMLRAATGLMEPIAVAKGVDVKLCVEEAVPHRSMGDQQRVRQILLNLIGNAVKFTNRGSVRIHVAVTRGQGADELRIDVADTGVGIPADRLEAIFEKFSQADSSIVRKFGGTGLGLSISTQLAAMMGGRISVSSEPDAGSVFTLHLPLREAVGVSLDHPKLTMESDRVPLSSQLRRARILVAEDHDINQALILGMAKQIGVEAVIAANGALAVAMVNQAVASREPYDLILMDVQMPVLDGLEATRRLRAAGFSAEALPIIALTANAYPEDVDACLSAGMQAHLSKPIRAADLQQVIDKYFGQPVSASSTSAMGTAVPPTIAMPIGLEQRYLQRKQEVFDTISRLAGQTSLAQEDFDRVIDMLHKLAGTAGMFGNPGLGDAAARLENELLTSDETAKPWALSRGWHQLVQAA